MTSMPGASAWALRTADMGDSINNVGAQHPPAYCI
jgi:hypothetical protein